MLRIDEDTYIDDTLVTCAEYQLFIDEMSERGKFHQPDHWTSYQFPAGQARAPIVGVHFNDAKASCEWLTRREAGEWSFRLPTSAETEQYPLKNPIQSPLGYWTTGPDGETQFAWVGSHTVNPRNLDRTRTRALDRALAFDFDFDRELDFALAHNHERDNVLDLALALDTYLDMYIDTYTLQERIAGRSPAFEGIRIVKERVK